MSTGTGAHQPAQLGPGGEQWHTRTRVNVTEGARRGVGEVVMDGSGEVGQCLEGIRGGGVASCGVLRDELVCKSRGGSAQSCEECAQEHK